MHDFEKKSIVMLFLSAGLLLDGGVAQATQYQAILLQPTTPAGFQIGPYFVGNTLQPDFEGQVVADHLSSSNQTEATLSEPNGTVVDLSPSDLPEIYESDVVATDGVNQVGSGGVSSGGFHALLWSGTGATAVDIGPKNWFFSVADAVDGNQIVGYGYVALQKFGYQALLWNGPSTNPIDLNPTALPGVTASVADGTDGVQQVGYSLYGTQLSDGANILHAVLWSGNAASAVDLNPATCYASQAFEVSGTQQVGIGQLIGSPLGAQHAFLWQGTAKSAVDLNPTNLDGEFSDSDALATNGVIQVGYGFNVSNDLVPSGTDALLWTGTANSAVNLQQLLPSNFVDSIAISIDNAGNIYGIADDSTLEYSVEWTPVPEPATALIAGPIGTVLLGRRRKKIGF